MSWIGRNGLKTLRVDEDFLENGEENLRFQKYPDTCGQAKTIWKSYVWMRIFSKMGKKKLRFQKYPDMCGQGLSWSP